MEPRRSKHFLARIPTIALLVLFAMSPWLGILFFILRAIDRDAEKKEQENAEYSSDFRSQDTGAGQPARDTEPVYGHDVPTAEQQNAKKWHKTLTSLCTVFGGIFLVVGLAGLADIIDMWGYWFDWGEFLTALAQTIGGGAALAMGLRMKQARKLERQLDKIVGTRDNIPLDELFAAAGIDADRGRAAVERAIDHGYFGADAYIDNRTGTLVVRGAAPQPPSRARTRTGSRGSVYRPAAPAPAGQRCHPRPGDDGQDLPAGGCQRPHLRTGKKGPGQKSPAAEIYGLLPAHRAEAAEYLRPALGTGCAGHQHH